MASNIIFLEVKPSKLSNRELTKVFEGLKRQKRIKAGYEDLDSNLKKANYLRNIHGQRYVTIRLRQSQLDAFVERNRIDDYDIKKVRGDIYHDIDKLEEDAEKEGKPIPNITYPAKSIVASGNAAQSVRNAIELMEQDPINTESNSPNVFKGENLDLTVSPAYDSAPESEEELQKETGTSVETEAGQEPEPEQVATKALPEPVFSEIDRKEESDQDESQDVTPRQRLRLFSGNSSNEEASIRPTKADREVFMMGTENKVQMKLDAGGSIPIWRKGHTDKEEIQNVRMYIRDLLRVRELGLTKSEAVLINASLVKSARTALYEEMPAEAEKSIDEFVKYLQRAYGSTIFELRKELETIKQNHLESPHTFMSRVITLYYESKGKTKKTVEEIMDAEDEMIDIVSIYLRGLLDSRVRSALKQRIDELKFDKVPEITRNIQNAMKEASDTSVNMIADLKDDLDDKLETISEAVNVLHISRPYQRTSYKKTRPMTNQYASGSRFSGNRGRGQTRGPGGPIRPMRSRFEVPKKWPTGIRCHNCDREGHMARDCRQPKRQMKTVDKLESRTGLPHKTKSCYNCGRSGHFAKECRAARQVRMQRR